MRSRSYWKPLEVTVPQVEDADRLGLATDPLIERVLLGVTLLLGDLVGHLFLLSREYERGIALVVGSALSDCFDNHVDEPEASRDDDHEQIEDEPAEGVLLGVTLACHCGSFQKEWLCSVQSEKLREPLVILSEPRQRFLARLRGKLRPKGAEPAIVVQPPLELSDLVTRFEKLFDPALVFVHPVVTRICGRISCRFEKRDVVLQR